MTIIGTEMTSNDNRKLVKRKRITLNRMTNYLASLEKELEHQKQILRKLRGKK